jgi:hypothetical protein
MCCFRRFMPRRDTHDLYITFALPPSMRQMCASKSQQGIYRIWRNYYDLASDAFGDAFSQSEYPAFREKLSSRDRELDIIRRAAEWELKRPSALRG